MSARRRRRLVSLAAATTLLGAGTFASAGTAVVAATAGGVVPLAHLASTAHFATPPTTAQCEAAFGIACYSPLQLETAYDMNSLYAKGLTGAGKTIVIVDSFGSPTIKADLLAFDKAYALPAPPSFSIIAPVGKVPAYDPNNATMTGWAEETSLDVEYSHAMAPGAKILLVETPVAETEGLGGIPQIVAAENYVINHHLGDVISQSFSATEGTFPTKQSLLDQRSAYVNAAKHDVTVLAATGDDGVTSDKNVAGTLLYEHRVVGWPATDPLVTAVGGTELFLDAAGDRQSSDIVWNDTNLLGAPAAGAGGVSDVFPRPAYQNGVASAVHGQRGVPDVSLSAAVNGGAEVYLGFAPLAAGFYIIGGTSEATPLFAGVVAVADQAAHHDLGQLNPTLYSLAAKKKPGIVDITAGNNTVSFVQYGKDVTVPGYIAAPGYDLASGLGTIDGAALVSELSGH